MEPVICAYCKSAPGEDPASGFFYSVASLDLTQRPSGPNWYKRLSLEHEQFTDSPIICGTCARELLTPLVREDPSIAITIMSRFFAHNAETFEVKQGLEEENDSLRTKLEVLQKENERLRNHQNP